MDKHFWEGGTHLWIRRQLHNEKFCWGDSFLERAYIIPRQSYVNRYNYSDNLKQNNDYIKNMAEFFPVQVVNDYLLSAIFYNFAISNFFPFFNKYFENYLYFEALLQADIDKGTYRDHLYHQIKVAEVIEFLMRQKNILKKASESLAKQYFYKKFLFNFPVSRFDKKEYFEAPKIKECIEKALWLAALFHDLGYVYNICLRLEGRLRKFFPFWGSSFGSDFNVLLDNHQFSETLLGHYLISKVPESKENLGEYVTKLASGDNHSVASAIQILLLRDHMKQAGFELNIDVNLIYEMAVLFIFVHDRFKNPTQLIIINFDDNPGGALLYIADNIQEWERFSLKNDEDSCSTVQVKIESNEIAISYKKRELIDGEKSWKDNLQGFPMEIKIQNEEPVAF